MTTALTELFPKDISFEIKDEHNNPILELTFRAFTINDSLWIQRNIGDQAKIEKVFNETDFKSICKIAFNQLCLDSKKKLFGVKFRTEDLDEDGNIVEVNLNGPQRIMELCKGPYNEVMLVNSLLQSRGFNSPETSDDDEEEKEGDDKKKTELTGQKFTT